jgi:hypothetical protein
MLRMLYHCGGSFRKERTVHIWVFHASHGCLTCICISNAGAVLCAFPTLFHGGYSCKIQRKCGKRSGRITLHPPGTWAFFFSRWRFACTWPVLMKHDHDMRMHSLSCTMRQRSDDDMRQRGDDNLWQRSDDDMRQRGDDNLWQRSDDDMRQRSLNIMRYRGIDQIRWRAINEIRWTGIDLIWWGGIDLMRWRGVDLMGWRGIDSVR